MNKKYDNNNIIIASRAYFLQHLLAISRPRQASKVAYLIFSILSGKLDHLSHPIILEPFFDRLVLMYALDKAYRAGGELQVRLRITIGDHAPPK
jgi:hypothetical protein